MLGGSILVVGQIPPPETPLFEAVVTGHLDEILKLKKISKNINWKDKNGITALMYAATESTPELIAELVARGADLELADGEGKTSFLYAAGASLVLPAPNPANLKGLAEAGANVNAVDTNGANALHWAVVAIARQVEGVKTLVELGVDVDRADRFGNTPLTLARQQYVHKDELVALLSAAGADPKAGGRREAEEESFAPEPSPLENQNSPSPALFSNLRLPLELRGWYPSQEELAAAGIEEDWDDEDGLAPPVVAVRLAQPSADAETESCRAVRRKHVEGWGDEVAPGVYVAGRTWYRYLDSGGSARPPVVRLSLDFGGGAEELDSAPASNAGAGQSLCVLGWGYWETGETRFDGLHAEGPDGSEYILQTIRGQILEEMRAAMAESLLYPAKRDDPAAFLTIVNEAGEFPVILLQSPPG
jgi:hypothetical protein